MIISRRFFLKSSGLTLFATGTAPSFLVRLAAMPSAGRKKVLVALFQRGAMDGLNAVVPYSDDLYYQARPTIALPRPGKGEGAVLDLDGRFGLHPQLAPFKPFWDDKSLAIIHAAGSPDATRSHFDAQDFMESATPGDKGTRDGWLNRYLEANERKEASPLRAVSMGPKLARSLQGSAPAVAINNLGDFRLPDKAPIKEGLMSMYGEVGAAQTSALMSRVSRDTFAALELVTRLDASSYHPANGASYPQSKFGESMKQIAQMIKADLGVEVAFADMGGWDTHTNEAVRLNNLLQEFSSTIAAFVTDLGSRMQDVVVLTMSEFGRTARENGNQGTDHGHANCMFVLGGVKGGRIYGDWPGLEREQLYESRDLALTTDFRDVFAEVLSRHMGAKKLEQIFPNYSPDRKKFQGFLTA